MKKDALKPTPFDDFLKLAEEGGNRCFDIIQRVADSRPDPMPTNEKPYSDDVEKHLKSTYGVGWARVVKYMAAGRRVDVAPENVSLENVFSAGHIYGSSRAEVKQMATAIESGEVIRKNEIMPHVEWLIPDDERDSVVSDNSFFSGSREHRTLCFDAAVWLLRKGMGLNMNLGYAGSGKADLFSFDGKMAVECGYTQAGKVLEGVMSGLSVAVIPYQEYAKTGYNVAFVFSRNPDKCTRGDAFASAHKHGTVIENCSKR